METLDFCCAGDDGSGTLVFDEQEDRFACKVCGKTYEFSDGGFTYYKINSISQLAYVLISIRAEIMEIHSVDSCYIFDDNNEFVYARAKRFSLGALMLRVLLTRKGTSSS